MAARPPATRVPSRPAWLSQMPVVRRVPRGLLTIAAVLGLYYVVPLDFPESVGGVVVTVLGLLASLAVLTWLLSRQARRLIHATPGDESVRLETLVLLVFVVVPLFAFFYFALQDADPSQFAELETKTDALYFSTSTIATVGFGDVHATGQIAACRRDDPDGLRPGVRGGGGVHAHHPDPRAGRAAPGGGRRGDPRRLTSATTPSPC